MYRRNRYFLDALPGITINGTSRNSGGVLPSIGALFTKVVINEDMTVDFYCTPNCTIVNSAAGLKMNDQPPLGFSNIGPLIRCTFDRANFGDTNSNFWNVSSVIPGDLVFTGGITRILTPKTGLCQTTTFALSAVSLNSGFAVDWQFDNSVDYNNTGPTPGIWQVNGNDPTSMLQASPGSSIVTTVYSFNPSGDPYAFAPQGGYNVPELNNLFFAPQNGFVP